MARFIDCPNNGKCGFGRHILGSDSYNKCLKAASGISVRGAVNNAVSSLPPAAAPHPRNRTEELLEALDCLRGCDSYLPPRSYVGDMTFDNDEIQGIIDAGSASHMKAEREQMLSLVSGAILMTLHKRSVLRDQIMILTPWPTWFLMTRNRTSCRLS